MFQPPFEKPIEVESLDSLRADLQLALDRLVFYKATCLLADALIAAGTGAGNVPALLQARMMLPGGAKSHPTVVRTPGQFAKVRDLTPEEAAREEALKAERRKAHLEELARDQEKTRQEAAARDEAERLLKASAAVSAQPLMKDLRPAPRGYEDERPAPLATAAATMPAKDLLPGRPKKKPATRTRRSRP